MSDIMITVDFMKNGWVLAIPLAIVGILTYLFNNKWIEWFFALLKTFFYGALAIFMWKYVGIKELVEIDIVTAFTFVFCCIECGDNSVKTIGMPMQAIKDFIVLSKKVFGDDKTW